MGGEAGKIWEELGKEKPYIILKICFQLGMVAHAFNLNILEAEGAVFKASVV